KKLLEAKFLRSQRMESLGSLAGGIAHDLNNALAPILMSVEMLKQVSKDPNPNTARMLDAIYSSAKRGAGMVKQILTFARGAEGVQGVVQPKHLIQEMINLTRHSFPQGIQLHTDVALDTWTLLGNPTQLHQILLNLCVNARDAMPKGGTLTLGAGNVRLKTTDAGLSPDAKPGPYVVLTVKDTGMGMTPAVREHLFEAFFTTKAPDKGTGLGLSTVRNIAKNHGGFLTVESEVGMGTTFKVYLPAQETTAATVAAVEQLALPMGRGELILVVDDEAAIRSIATQTLEAYGYRVVTAKDGAEAVGLCAQNLAGLHLLITDMDMPIMDGPAAIRAVRVLAPRVKVVAVSGSGSLAGSPLLKELNVQTFLHKPFSADDLVRTVHEALHGAPTEP
ncbi:MAG: ATP-binding protein, partial [Limisphaerales bacterium]